MCIGRNLIALTLLLLAAGAGAQQGGDLQAQILYAYQVEDLNQLTDLIQDLTAQVNNAPTDTTLRYHLAHAQYRLGLVAGEAHAHRAEAAFSACIDELKPVLEQDVKSVESLALQSACYASLAGHRKLEAVLLRSRATDRLNAAYQLAPRNPRVLFLLSQRELKHAKAGSAEYDQAFAQLVLAVKIFEQSSATSIDAVGWGHAEAYLALGTQLQARGDRIGARNWIEKSLIAAPDYKAAQRQLALLSRG
jgi:tetratricopeptide (TPR) repeat protein